jgi:hypothetical protein
MNSDYVTGRGRAWTPVTNFSFRKMDDYDGRSMCRSKAQSMNLLLLTNAMAAASGLTHPDEHRGGRPGAASFLI